jgi:hypothetical protein
MNLLTNGFVNNCGRLFRPSEQFEADIVRVGIVLDTNEANPRQFVRQFHLSRPRAIGNKSLFETSMGGRLDSSKRFQRRLSSVLAEQRL